MGRRADPTAAAAADRLELAVQGRASSKDFTQFTNAGVDILPSLATHFGVVKSEVMGLVEKGRVGNTMRTTESLLEQIRQILTGIAGSNSRMEASTTGAAAIGAGVVSGLFD